MITRIWHGATETVLFTIVLDRNLADPVKPLYKEARGKDERTGASLECPKNRCGSR